MKPLSLILMVLFGALLFACAPSGSTTKAETAAFDLENAIKTAKTPADHERIAAYYEQEAAEYKKKAAQHERMSNEYEMYKFPIHQKGHDMARASAHCKDLARLFSQTGEEYLSLAREHRQLAE
jgi:hypothetical protein